jgi:glycerophosphoryl diester phosphodiesterase
MKQPLNLAHRGGAGLWPENTVSAFAHAACSGYDGAELDVQLTRDGKLVVFHDFRLRRELCRDEDGKWIRPPLPLVRNLDASELQRFDVGRAKPRTLYARRHPALHPRDGEHIPLLSQVIAAVRSEARNFRLFLEIKTSFDDRRLSASPQDVARALVAELRSERFLGSSVIVSFDWPALLEIKRVEPKLACWFLTQGRARLKLRGRRGAWADDFHPRRFGGSVAEAILRAGGDGWLCPRSSANGKAVREAHERGLKFGVWTVNQRREMKKLVKLGVDAIITDRPDRMAEI